MRYSAVAAALVGAVYADWETWSSSTTPVEETSTSTWNTWSTPVEETSTTPSTSATTWNTWSTPVSETSTTSSTWNTWSTPVSETSTTTASTWNTWSTPVSETSTTVSTWNTWSTPVSETSTTVSTWNTWSTPVSETSTTVSTWNTWSTPVSETSTDTWSTWATYSTPVEETSTETWSTWATYSTPVEETSTETWSTWETYSTPVEESSTVYTWNTWESSVEESSTWSTPEAETSTWASWESTTTVEATTVETWSTYATPVVTQSVSAGWSSNGWFGPAWATAGAGQCVTNVLTSYGAATWSPTPSSPAASTWSTLASWSTPAVEVQSATWSTVAIEVQSATASASGSISTYTTIPEHGNKWSMTYTPYNAQSKCKTQDAITADIDNIAKLGFVSVRVYSTDCHILEYVGEAVKANNMKMILGVYIDNTGINGAKSQVTDIISWAQWDLVEIIVIGNEAVQSGYVSAQALAAFITQSKSQFSAAGYTGPCTTTEPLDQWQANAAIFCGVVDVVSANLYAYFNNECTAENAGDFILSEINILEGLCPKKEVYVMECGWPSEGECNGAACPSPENQKTAITSIQEKCGEQIVWFSYENELWKSPGPYNVEQHWGCADVFGGSSWSNTGSPAATSTSPAWITPSASSTWATWSSAAPTSTTSASWASY